MLDLAACFRAEAAGSETTRQLWRGVRPGAKPLARTKAWERLTEEPAGWNHRKLKRHLCSWLDSASLATRFPIEASMPRGLESRNWHVVSKAAKANPTSLQRAFWWHEPPSDSSFPDGNRPDTEKHKCDNV
ncbi:hypothetical protein [Wenzhouxiangella sp. EGI_FJ10409]|uniref:hypothetical protein n=1 Tax=Wenzhouxiangella sp. EGI_FJ10409 TaxID=3243767 RepID=UPI0035D827AE